LLSVLKQLGEQDAAAFYEAIRLAEPGGLGHVDEQDVSRPPTRGILEIMKLAAQRDLIAKQYVTGFDDGFKLGVPALQPQLNKGEKVESAIIFCHLKFMATYPDSLIARKCGVAVANEARARAQTILAQGWPLADWREDELTCFDHWLRADGNRRNPGTS